MGSSSRSRPPKPCKICKHPSRFLCSTANAYGGVAELDHYRCTGCGLVFVGSHLTLEQTKRAYAELAACGAAHQSPEENEAKLAAALEAVLERVLPDGRIVDIGAGDGEFARVLRGAGYRNVAVHEIPGRDLAHLSAHGIAIFQDLDYRSLPDDTYDFVSLLDVAEHVLYPTGLLRACHRVLRPGGTLYIQVPAVTLIDRIMHAARRMPIAAGVGQRWQAGRTSIFHLQIFTIKALEIALRKAGFARFTIEQRNHLAFTPAHYVRSHLCEKQRLPPALAPLLVPLVFPFLTTTFFNANRGFVWAEKTPARCAN